MLRMRSPQFLHKPASLVTIQGDATFEDIGYREKAEGEPVHYRDKQHLKCEKCGAKGGVWTDDHTIWVNNATKCV